MESMGEVNLQLEPNPDAACHARSSIRERFADAVPAAILHDLQIVVTELVTNSVKYGPGGMIGVRLDLSSKGIVRGEVCDQGTGEARPAIRDSPSLEGGLGLQIVDALTERWAVDNGSSTRVWFEVSLA